MNAFLDIVSKDPCPTLEEIESLIGENERLKEVLNHFKKTVARGDKLSPDEQSLFRGARDAYTQIRLLNLCESLGALLQDKNMGKKIREEIKARQDSLLNK